MSQSTIIKDMLEFKALDSNFQLLTLLTPTNIQWNRKYYTYGDFTIIIPIEQYSSNIKYIYTKDRPETGEVKKMIKIEDTKYVQLSGYFLERTLNDKVIYPTFYGSGQLIQTVENMIRQYKEDIPIKEITHQEGLISSNIEYQETGSELADKCYETLQTQEMSYKCVYNFEKDELNVIIYKGEDKTQSTEGNEFVTFSTVQDTIKNPTINIDKSKYKNYFIIAGSDKDENRIVAYLDLSNGGYKYKQFVDQRDIQFDDEKQTLEEYKEELIQKGLEKSLDYVVEQTVNFKIVPQGYEYMKDYDLGTKVDCVLEEYGLQLEVRIVEIYEVMKENNISIELKVGNVIRNKNKLRR